MELPSGWDLVTLDVLVGPDGVFTDGDWVETKDQDPDGDVRLIQLADIGDGVFRDRSSRFLAATKAKELRCTFLEPGDVLVARMPDPLGRASLFPGTGQPSVTAVDVCIVRPGPRGCNNRWLMHAVNAPQFRTRVAALQSGTTRKRISRRNLATIEIPTPPLAEQRRIVEAIEEQFSRLDAAEESLRRAYRNLVRYRLAALLSEIEGNWERRPLGELLVSLKNGLFISRPAAEPPGTPIFRISAVRPMWLNVEDVRYAPLDATNAEGYFVEEGDLLFTRYSGNPSFVGACARVPHLERPTLHPDKLIKAVVNASVADSAYLEIVLSVGEAHTEIEERRKTTAGQVGISGSQLKSVLVPTPALDIQREVVANVRRQASVTEALDRGLTTSLQRIKSLRSAVLREAFAGRLVTQDPSDEPVSAFLKAVRT